jgi:hypothetical protein
MSKIALSGDASGTGTFTIASPNSNSNYTMTLPSANGTVQVSGNPISGTTGSFSSTVGVGGATPANTGAGITFPATQSASSDANTLDDYEEGTWTVTLSGSISGSTTNGFSGFYTKIGNLVYARIQALNPDAATIGGSWRFSLPFTARSNEYMGAYVSYQRSIPTVSSGTWLSGAVFSGTALVGLIYNKNTTAESEGVSGNVPGATLLMGMTVVYLTAS